MLALEGATLLALQGAVSSNLDRAPRTQLDPLGSTGQTAASLRAALARLLHKARTQARGAATDRFEAEVKLYTRKGLERTVTLGADAATYDAARAVRAASAFADNWLARVLRTLSESTGGSTKTVFRGASRQELWRIKQASTSEVAEAWGDQRRLDAKRLAALPGVQLWKVWDAALDRRTCPICVRADGTAVPANQDFPQGVPGGVHASCRCQETLLPIDMIDMTL